MCQALAQHGVEVLLDVRQVPWSQRPEFRKLALAEGLRAHGIEYVHMKSAGNPFRPKKGEPRDVASWARPYADHLEAHPEIVEELARGLRERTGALLCFEAAHGECHRALLFDALQRKLPDLQVEQL